MNEIRNKLFELKDSGYKDFNCKLIPTVNIRTVIGIRVPILRRYAKEIKNSDMAKDFLKALPHRYFEENNLHAFLIAEINGYDECIKKVNEFLPYIDNWATCDSFKPKCFNKNKDKLILEIKNWLVSPLEYTVRFGILMLLTYFLDGDFKREHLDMVCAVKQGKYYIDMMVSWYFATAIAKQYESSVKYLEETRLSKFVHNKTIQKAVESFRVTKEKKDYLKTLKIK